jgi:prophage DNA circulation protein
MSWRDQIEKGSFRGAEFRTESDELLGGRRVVSHEFPGRDDPVTEDLGMRARQFTIECHTIGANWISQREQLRTALDAQGPGLLVHPQYGRMMVVVFEYSCGTSTEEGGMARFSITFGDAGQAVAAPSQALSGDAIKRAAEAAKEGALEDFAASFSIAQAAAFVEDSAADLISGIGEVSKLAAGLRGGIGPTLRAFEAGLDLLPADVSSLLRAPLSLGRAISGLAVAVSALGGGGRRTRLQSLELMLDWEPELDNFPVRTPQRVLEENNRIALLQLFRTAVAAELVRTAAEFEFPSYDEAVAVRDSLSARLDREALAAADRGDDDGASRFDSLRRVLAVDIARRGATLARIYGLSLAASEPALVLAHRLYGGDAGRRRDDVTSLPERAAAIVARNQISHPGFLPGGLELALLTAAPEAGVRAA